jgi:transcriptional regulator with XRE-family HTH domain
MSTFSERLAKSMESHRFNKSSLSRELGVTHSTVARWLAGSVPSGDTLPALARILNVSVRWLMQGDDLPGSKDSSILDESTREGSQSNWADLFYKVAHESSLEWIVDRIEQLSQAAAEGDVRAAQAVSILVPIFRKRVESLQRLPKT